MPVTINPPAPPAPDQATLNAAMMPAGTTLNIGQPGAPSVPVIDGQPPIKSDGADYIVINHQITDGKGGSFRMGDKINSATDLPDGAVKWLVSQGAIAALDVPPAADPDSKGKGKGK